MQWHSILLLCQATRWQLQSWKENLTVPWNNTCPMYCWVLQQVKESVLYISDTKVPDLKVRSKIYENDVYFKKARFDRWAEVEPRSVEQRSNRSWWNSNLVHYRLNHSTDLSRPKLEIYSTFKHTKCSTCTNLCHGCIWRSLSRSLGSFS